MIHKSSMTGVICAAETAPRVGQKLQTLPEHYISYPVFSGVRVARYLVFCVMFCRSLVVHFLLTITLSVILRLMASDYPLVSSNSS